MEFPITYPSDLARRDETRRDRTSRDKTRMDETRRDETRRDKTRTDKMRRNKTARDETRRDRTRRHNTRMDIRLARLGFCFHNLLHSISGVWFPPPFCLTASLFFHPSRDGCD